MHRYKYLMIAAVAVILVAASARYAHLDEKHGPVPSESAPDEAMVEQQPLTELPENISIDDLIKQKPDKTLTVKTAKKDIELWPAFFVQLRVVPFVHNGKVDGLKVLSVKPNGFWDFLQRGDVILSINDKPIDVNKFFFGPAYKECSTFRVYRDKQVILIKVKKSNVSQSTPPEPAPGAAMVEQQRSLSRPPENVSVEDLIKQKPVKTLTKKMSKKDIARWSSGADMHIRAVPSFHNGKAEGIRVLSAKPGGMLEFLQRGDVILSINDKPVDVRKGFSGFAGKGNITFRVYRNNQVILIKVEGTE